MDFLAAPSEMMAVASTLLLLLMSTNRAFDLPLLDTEENTDNSVELMTGTSHEAVLDMETVTRVAMYCFRLNNAFCLLGDDLGYWVNPRSTTWFSRFLLDQYDNQRWVAMFRMMKPAVYNLAEIFKPRIQRKDTNYRFSIPMLVRVVCTLFKLTYGASLFICSKMFAIGKSTAFLVLRDVVEAINISLRSEIAWPTGEKLLQTEAGFQQLCGLPGIIGAIDGTHVSICKPRNGPVDYYYFKPGGYTLNCQVVVDSNKRFLDLFLGMPGSTNDSRVLRCSSLYQKGMHGTLWDSSLSFNGFNPYLLRDFGYPLLPWLLVPHRGHSNLPIVDALFNRKMREGRGVVKNAFGILKQTFRKLLLKLDLQVTFLPDVITYCAILHNMLLGQSHDDVETLLEVLHIKGLNDHKHDDQPTIMDAGDSEKRRQLGVFLAVQRNMAM